MIYACLPFLREWATPLTVINYMLLGLASGFTLATAATLASARALQFLAAMALLLTALGLVGRAASLYRNARLRPKSTLQTAIGVKHPQIVQKSQGFIGDSFNTREFFHGRTTATIRSVKWLFLLGAFVLPAALLAMGLAGAPRIAFVLAFVVQYRGTARRALVLLRASESSAESVLPGSCVGHGKVEDAIATRLRPRASDRHRGRLRCIATLICSANRLGPRLVEVHLFGSLRERRRVACPPRRCIRTSICSVVCSERPSETRARRLRQRNLSALSRMRPSALTPVAIPPRPSSRPQPRSAPHSWSGFASKAASSSLRDASVAV